MIAHNVYFTLIDNSEAAVQMLLAACQKYLVDHPGIASFACGPLAIDHARDVNDRDWDVGLHIVFTDKAAHDRYQDAPLHQQFIAESKLNWKRVRVFDTVLA
ncbi:MAG: Dabb family protein [Chloroflexi bacterium]|nr:Dabb family protein [Chloroflexota bacterium]